MTNLRKESLTDLQDFPSAFVWPTELNELRPLSREPLERQVSILLRELKILALFHPHVLIEDPYVVNCIGFQHLLLRDASSLRRAIEAGVIVLLLRPSFASYSEANDVVNTRRFIPGRYREVGPALAEIDHYLAANRIPVHLQPLVSDYTFEIILEKLIHSTTLGAGEADLLSSALEFARGQSTDGYVSSADVYRRLQRYSPKSTSRPIQACRAARVLVGPLGLHVPASVAESDVARSFVLAAAGATIALDLDRAESLIARYPQRILPVHGLDEITFSDICQLREQPSFARYRRALIHLRKSLASAGDDDPLGLRRPLADAPWRDAFLDYLAKLQLYLEDIGRQKQVELVPWLSYEAKVAVDDEAEKRERRLLQLMRIIPICGAAWWEALAPVYGFQLLPAAIGGLASLAAEEVHRAVVKGHPTTFRRLLNSQEKILSSTVATRMSP